ncbi:MAG TPA: DUF1579 domain-containing protein [Allosphingosinicella sp.]|nr:DUF1579 domain-containing protein [Allosphingosinicella sp.]
MRILASTLIALSLSLAAAPVAAQAPDATARIEAQRQAMARLAFMDGVWRGPAWSVTPAGRHEIVQTERIGTFLGGSVRVVEGRGYNADGSVGFNAFGVISFDPASGNYSFSTWAQGRSGVFAFRVTPNGYEWETQAGPGAIVRYTATIEGDRFREVGYRIAGNAPPLQIFEMNLRRVGDTDWPAAGAVPRQ